MSIKTPESRLLDQIRLYGEILAFRTHCSPDVRVEANKMERLLSPRSLSGLRLFCWNLNTVSVRPHSKSISFEQQVEVVLWTYKKKSSSDRSSILTNPDFKGCRLSCLEKKGDLISNLFS